MNALLFPLIKIIASLFSCLKVLFFLLIFFFFPKTSPTKVIFVKFQNLSIQKLSNILLLCKVITENSFMRLFFLFLMFRIQKRRSYLYLLSKLFSQQFAWNVFKNFFVF